MPPPPASDRILRYTLSAREFALLQKHVLSRFPSLAKRIPKYPAGPPDVDDATTSTIRTAVRLFLSTYLALRTYSTLLPRLTRKPKSTSPTTTPFRISLTLPLLLLLHRFIYRFLWRLRSALLSPEAKGFRRRNPRLLSVLGARVAPAAGAGLLGGLALGVWPKGAGRRAMAVWVVERAGEGVWTWMTERGLVGWRPWVGWP
jgi:hypothetical protein